VIISIMNFKGASQKTFLTRELTKRLTRQGKRIVVIDLDPDETKNFSHLYVDTNILASSTGTLYQALVGDPPAQPVQINADMFFWLLPGNQSLHQLEQWLVFQSNSDEQLAQFLHSSFLPNQYDYCFVDCPPLDGHLARNAIVAADAIFIPGGEQRTREQAQRIRQSNNLPPTIYEIQTVDQAVLLLSA
jgi:chromosome partitioning protein